MVKIAMCDDGGRLLILGPLSGPDDCGFYVSEAGIGYPKRCVVEVPDAAWVPYEAAKNEMDRAEERLRRYLKG